MCDHCGCRAFPPIADLSAEHETILRLAWQIAEAMRDGVAMPEATRDELLVLLDRHIRTEEEAFYPLLVDHGDLDAAAAELLEAEHDDVIGALVDGRFDRRAYYALGAHIEQEEMELFPAAMFGFDDVDWARLEPTPAG